MVVEYVESVSFTFMLQGITGLSNLHLPWCQYNKFSFKNVFNTINCFHNKQNDILLVQSLVQDFRCSQGIYVTTMDGNERTHRCYICICICCSPDPIISSTTLAPDAPTRYRGQTCPCIRDRNKRIDRNA